jgi:hypothetical protein
MSTAVDQKPVELESPSTWMRTKAQGTWYESRSGTPGTWPTPARCGPEGPSGGPVAASSLGVPGLRSRLDPPNKRVL